SPRRHRGDRGRAAVVADAGCSVTGSLEQDAARERGRAAAVAGARCPAASLRVAPREAPWRSWASRPTHWGRRSDSATMNRHGARTRGEPGLLRDALGLRVL